MAVHCQRLCTTVGTAPRADDGRDRVGDGEIGTLIREQVVRRGAETRPSALVLLLHGGSPSSRREVGALRPAWLQVRQLQWAIAGDARARGFAIWALRLSVAG